MKSNTIKVLIATEGNETSVFLLDWIFRRANLFKDIRVVIRGHPNMSAEYLISKCIFKIPIWFEISKSTLNEDLIDSSCVIYMQTSIGIQALLNGIPIIHLNINSPLSCDPLFKYHGELKWVVKNSEDLKMS